MTEVHIGKTLLTTLINFLTLPATDVAKADAMEALGALTHGNVDTFQAYMARKLISEGRMAGGLFDADPYTVTEYGVQFLLDLIAKARVVAFSETDAAGDGVAGGVLSQALQEEAERAAYLKTPMGMSATEVSLMYPPLGNTELARVGVQGNLKYVPGEPGHHNLFMLVCFVMRAERYKADPELSGYQEEAAALLSKLDKYQAARRAISDGYRLENIEYNPAGHSVDRMLGAGIYGTIPAPSEDGIVLNEEQFKQLQFKPYERLNFGHMLWTPAFKFDFRTRASRRLLENGLFRDLQKEHGANARATAKKLIAELVKKHGKKVVTSQHTTTLHLALNKKPEIPEEWVEPKFQNIDTPMGYMKDLSDFIAGKAQLLHTLKGFDWNEEEFGELVLTTAKDKERWLVLWGTHSGIETQVQRAIEVVKGSYPNEEELNSKLGQLIEGIGGPSAVAKDPEAP